MSKLVKKQPFNFDLITRYKNFRKALSDSIKLARETYYRNKINENLNNPKKLWLDISEIAGTSKTKEVFPIERFENYEPDNSIQLITLKIADSLNEYFVSVGVKLAINFSLIDATNCAIDDRLFNANAEFCLIPVTEEQLEECVRELRGGSAPGIDGITADTIKNNFHTIKTPILSEWLIRA